MKAGLTFVFALPLIACGGASGREVSGEIREDTIWTRDQCPVLVKGSINVRAGRTLTIDPGCTVRFTKGTTLAVSSGTTESGAIRAIGTVTEPIIFTSANDPPAPGDWNGLAFYETTADARTRFEHVQITGAGGADSGAAVEAHGVKLDFVSVSINGAITSGIYFGENGGFAPTANGVSVTNAQAYGISITANQAGTMPRVVNLTGNVLGAAEIRGGEVTDTQTWRSIGAQWVVTESINVGGPKDPVLTIEAQTRLAFAPGKAFSVALTNNDRGSVRTQGATNTEVVFTSTLEQRGAWSGVSIMAPSARSTTLSGTIIEYGGDNPHEGGLVIFNSQPVLQNIEVRESKKDGIVLAGPATGSPEIGAGSLAIRSKGNSGVGLKLPANALGTIPEGECDFSGNGSYGVLVSQGSVRKTQTWQAVNAAYVFGFDLDIGASINSEVVLTLQPGVVIAFLPGFQLSVGPKNFKASLRALGQPTKPVVFTSAETSPIAGDWAGVRFFSTATAGSAGANGSRLQYTQVRYAGNAADKAALTIDAPTAKPALDTVEITQSGGFGACITDGNAELDLGGELTISGAVAGNYCPLD